MFAALKRLHLRPLRSLPTLKCCPFCNSRHPSLSLPSSEGPLSLTRQLSHEVSGFPTLSWL